MLPRSRVLLVVLGVCASLPAAAETLYLKAARFFDGKSDALQQNVGIVVEGKKIVRAGPGLPIPKDAKVIDLGDRTVMPGLVDAHTHIALHSGDYDGQILREPPEYRAIQATVSAKATLEAGVTTLRDLGNEGAGFADIALRDAIAKGLVPGPRILAAIRPVTSTGAYRLTGYSPYTTLPALASAADGVAEVRKEVRKLVEQDADVIKIYMESYEKRQPRTDVLSGAMNYSPEEVNALVEEAHRAGLKVAAHTYSDAAAKLAIAAGADSIEHGLYLSDATFRTMAEKGIYYVPTLLVYEDWRDGKIFSPNPSPEEKAKLANTVREHTETFKRALASKVKIAFGTDTYERPGSNPQELELMVRYGMRPIDALRSATSVAAQLLGVGELTGTLEAGKSADLIAVPGNPLQDMTVMRRVSFVMKEGAVYVNR